MKCVPCLQSEQPWRVSDRSLLPLVLFTKDSWMKPGRSLVSCVLLLFVAILISACCGDIQLPNSVVAGPLYQAEIPQDIDQLADIFDRNFLDELPAEDTYLSNDYLSTEFLTPSTMDMVKVRIELFKSEEEGERYFKDECNDGYQYPHKFTYVGSPGNQYCISYIKQARESPEGLCAPYEKFFSKVVFQKGRILITLKESARDTTNEDMNRVIEILAEQFNR